MYINLKSIDNKTVSEKPIKNCAKLVVDSSRFSMLNRLSMLIFFSEARSLATNIQFINFLD